MIMVVLVTRVYEKVDLEDCDVMSFMAIDTLKFTSQIRSKAVVSSK